MSPLGGIVRHGIDAVSLAATRGIAHKSDIAPILGGLGIAGRTDAGDDCAIIADAGGYLLLAIEGFLDGFVDSDPYFAGYCGVMVNASDVFAMGGRPIAIVDALWSDGLDDAQALVAGLAFGAATYGIPIVGGHTNTRSGARRLAVSILGRATHLLLGAAARPGDVLLAAIDLRGRLRTPAAWWDASSEAARAGLGARLRADLEVLPGLAEDGLAHCAKDISMGGLIGTALMLAEASRVGLEIDAASIPRPDDIDPALWLTCFPSFGFLIAAPADHRDAIVSRFRARSIACAAIGTCVEGSRVRLDGETVWDFADGPLTGARPGSDAARG